MSTPWFVGPNETTSFCPEAGWWFEFLRAEFHGPFDSRESAEKAQNAINAATFYAPRRRVTKAIVVIGDDETGPAYPNPGAYLNVYHHDRHGEFLLHEVYPLRGVRDADNVVVFAPWGRA